MTVAMVLAERTHNSSRGQTIARAGAWGREMNHTATIWDPPTPQPELFSLYEEEPGGSRPDRIATLSGPQERVLRRTVLQIVDAVPSLPTLDDPAPQMVEQLPDIMHFFDALTPDPEQVIEVPKIIQHTVLQRSSLQEPQLAEQLVEVPTPCFRSCRSRFFCGCGWVWLVGDLLTRGGLLVEDGHLPHPVDLPTGDRQARAAAATVADVAVVDVPVGMQHKFQQSLFMNPEVLDSVR